MRFGIAVVIVPEHCKALYFPLSVLDLLASVAKLRPLMRQSSWVRHMLCTNNMLVSYIQEVLKLVMLTEDTRTVSSKGNLRTMVAVPECTALYSICQCTANTILSYSTT